MGRAAAGPSSRTPEFHRGASPAAPLTDDEAGGYGGNDVDMGLYDGVGELGEGEFGTDVNDHQPEGEMDSASATARKRSATSPVDTGVSSKRASRGLGAPREPLDWTRADKKMKVPEVKPGRLR